MKINFNDEKPENIYKVGNVIRNGDDFYLIADSPEGELFAVDLHTNLVYGTYKTMADLFNDLGDEDDVLVYAEINVF